MKKSSLFAAYCLLFILGIFISSFISFDFDIIYIFIILLLCLALSIASQDKKVRLGLVGISIFLLGVWRFGLSLPEINQNHIAYYNGGELEFIGQVIDEPDIRDKHRKLTMSKILFSQGPGRGGGGTALAGKILVNAPNYPEYNYGDWLEVECQIEQPGYVEDFDYGKFLAVKGIYSVCYLPDKIEFTAGKISAGQKMRQKILGIKYNYQEIINQAVSYPESEILSAMILGLRRGIPEKVLETFRLTGLSHIIAISGLHISIVTVLLMNLFIALGLRRRYAFVLATISLIIFLAMIGFRASSIRAGIMGFVALLALQSGRLNKSINALLLAGGILLLINPKLLVGDVGFQLSFLAVTGIIYLAGYIGRWLTKLRIPEFFQIKSSLEMTLSAQIMVLPLIVYYFGNLSLVAPLTNILVLPLLPFIMVIGFGLGIAGFIFLPLAKLIGYGVNLLIGWVEWVAGKLSALPGANFELKEVDIVWVIIVYMLLFWGVWLIKNMDRDKKNI